MKNNKFKLLKRILAIALCAFISFAYMPLSVYAEDEPQGDDNATEVTAITETPEEEIPDGEESDNDELLMGFFDKEVSSLIGEDPESGVKLRAKKVTRGQ